MYIYFLSRIIIIIDKKKKKIIFFYAVLQLNIHFFIKINSDINIVFFFYKQNNDV